MEGSSTTILSMTEARSKPRVSRLGRRLPRVVIVVIVLIVVAIAVASRITLNYYLLSPGDAQPVNPLIKVPSDRAHHISGSVLLTDVFLAQVTALSYIPNLLSSDDQVVPADELVGTGIPSSELVAQGYLEMVQAKAAAKTAALRRVGHADLRGGEGGRRGDRARWGGHANRVRLRWPARSIQPGTESDVGD